MHNMALPGQFVLSLLLMMPSHVARTADSLVSLAVDFWRRRGQIQPSSGITFEPGCFNRSFAQDPGPGIVHEGMPGRYLQKVLSWPNENPIRNHFYDSGANEGIGFT